MNQYRVTFFQNVGHECTQATVEVRCAGSVDRAIATAQHRLARAHCENERHHQTDYFERDIDGGKAN